MLLGAWQQVGIFVERRWNIGVVECVMSLKCLRRSQYILLQICDGEFENYNLQFLRSPRPLGNIYKTLLVQLRYPLRQQKQNILPNEQICASSSIFICAGRWKDDRLGWLWYSHCIAKAWTDAKSENRYKRPLSCLNTQTTQMSMCIFAGTIKQ